MRYELKDIVRIGHLKDEDDEDEDRDQVESKSPIDSLVENFHLGSDGNYHWDVSKDEVQLVGSPSTGSCKSDQITTVWLINKEKRQYKLENKTYLVKGKKVNADFYKLKKEDIILSSLNNEIEFVEFERSLSEEAWDMVVNLKRDFSHYKDQNNNHGFTYVKQNYDGLVLEFPSELGDKYNLKKAEFHINQKAGDYNDIAFHLYFDSKDDVQLGLNITYNDLIRGEDIYSSIDRLFKMVDIVYSQRDFIGI